MSSKTKIVVLRMKEIIYTAIFVGLGILLITLFLVMFRPKKDTVPTSGDAVAYVPGVYSSAITLNSQDINVEVTVDSKKITSVTLVPLSEAVTTMYPLMQPAMDNLSPQILKNQSTKNISYPSESRYTSSVLLKAVDQALTKAQKTD
ncbi:uncharacterized protein with FMN-binding domain [Lacrimispora xylanisolvens]|jgi:uncharacterized protein with FMN-binding domain|uniref:Uncharacterized protein with FMN-binding domain n=1 Tax=Lacrimispora xylanisolvens TaxID=384636 RepID=A0A2S6HUB2_9FIRM|nr:hypothetical protein [Hungatella xylanolytica]MBE5983575.1 hypothetical protein [Paenibacillaceae bacterium]MBE5988780.1 hypothetical protein [Paenibacillaceae bacterium]MBE5992026.1 hypothetical protein [Paenibacillaceae bacterium]PPK81421.1 uncharacterized protein with FMN-binding domain [Hungatella xylanolytica]